MKKTIMLILAIAGSLTAADFTGVWSGKGGREDVRYGLVPQSAQLALVQSGNTLTGSMTFNNRAAVKISSGTVTGNAVVFSIITGGQITGNFSQVGTQLTGKMTSSDGQVYDFVFTRN